MTDRTLADELVEIESRAAAIRANAASKIAVRFGSTRDVPRGFSGIAYVEEDATVLTFEHGLVATNIYTVEALSLRESALRQIGNGRDDVFRALLSKLPMARILNIGAGNDLAIEAAATAGGHEIVHTDLSQAVIQKLKMKCSGRAAAFDLNDLSTVVDAKSFSLITGNSVLGYIHPEHLNAILAQVAAVLENGLFTFDMAPSAHYVRRLEQTRELTVLNESSPDPRLLERFIDELGREDGPAAFLRYFGFRDLSVHLALLDFLKSYFTSAGFTTRTSTIGYTAGGGSSRLWILRVGRKPDSSTLAFVSGEREVADADSLEAMSADGVPRSPLIYVDRARAARIWTKLGTSWSLREAPWELIRYINNGEFAPSRRAIEAVTAALSRPSVAATVRATINSPTPERVLRMSPAVERDQALRGHFLQGLIPQVGDGPEAIHRIDASIDEGYAEQASREQQRVARDSERDSKTASRKRAADAKKQRKKNRR